MAKKRSEPPKPLKHFDYSLVASRMEGLFFNIDRDLRRRIDQAGTRGDIESDRCLTLMNVMVRFAWNSYHTILYITGDIPKDPRRLPTYVLVVPNINRQLLDLLFSLAYMLDDFRNRSLTYQRAGFRELSEEVQVFKNHFSKDKEWKLYFKTMKLMLARFAERHQVTAEEQKNPKAIPYWKTPYQLIDEQTPCREFLKYLEKWLYKDTSAQTHLGFGGLMKVSGFLIADIIGEDAKKEVADRPMKMYHFTQVSRTAITFLAIATEIDTHCNLGNRASIDYLWIIFSEHVAEAREMYKVRYQDRP
jgi:hypothetical protein